MNVVPFVREGLGNSSYLVEVGPGEAVVVDPDRLVERYFNEAAHRRLNVVGVFETHVHADFVSGACEAIARSDIRIYLPREGGYRFPFDPLGDGQKLRLCDTEIEVIGTPGHTPEHLSYAFRKDRETPMVFSGGALIAGGAARTDLISPEMTAQLTRSLFRTLKHAFRTLTDETRVLPTHGGGSFCSVGDSPNRTSTIGMERAHNPVLQFSSEEEFVSWFPSTFPSTPAYYLGMRAINQAGPRLRRDIAPPRPLSAEEFRKSANSAWIVDVRRLREFAQGHIPGALSVEFRDGFGVWVGALVPAKVPLLFVPGRSPVESLVEECLLVGYDDIAGYLDGGMEAWNAAGLPSAQTEIVTRRNARDVFDSGALVLDVREEGEFKTGHLATARHLPVVGMPTRLGDIPRGRPLVTQCAHGVRSVSAASLLERAGYGPVRVVAGGLEVWRDAGLPVTEPSSHPRPGHP